MCTLSVPHVEVLVCYRLPYRNIKILYIVTHRIIHSSRSCLITHRELLVYDFLQLSWERVAIMKVPHSLRHVAI